MTDQGGDGWASPGSGQGSGEGGGQGGGWAAPGGPPSWGAPQQPPAYGQQPGHPVPPPAYPQYPQYPQQPRAFELRPGVVPLRPLSVGDILDGAFAVVRRYPKQVLTFSVGISLVTALVRFVISVSAPHTSTTQTTDAFGEQSTQFHNLGSGLFFTMLSVIVSGTLTSVLAGTLTPLVGDAVLGRRPTTRQLWERVRPLLPAVILSSLLVLLCAVGGIVTLGIVSVLVWTWWALVTPAIVLEKLGTKAGLGRSYRLVSGSFWRILGILIVASLIAGIISALLQAPFLIGAFVLDGHFLFTANATVSTGAQALIELGSFLVGSFVLPFTAGVHCLLYVDQRMRREGLDVALRQAAGSA